MSIYMIWYRTKAGKIKTSKINARTKTGAVKAGKRKYKYEKPMRVLKLKEVKKPKKKKTIKKKNPVKKLVKKRVKKNKPIKKIVKKRVKKNESIKKSIKSTCNSKKKGRAKMAKKKIKRRRRINPGFSAKGITSFLQESGLVLLGAIGSGMAAEQIPIKDKRIRAVLPAALATVAMSTKFGRQKLMKPVLLGMFVTSGLALTKQFAPNLPFIAGESNYYLPDYSDEGLGVPVEQLGVPVEELGQPITDQEIDQYIDEQDAGVSGNEMENWQQ